MGAAARSRPERPRAPRGLLAVAVVAVVVAAAAVWAVHALEPRRGAVDWRFASTSGRSLSVDVIAGGCTGALRTRVEETAAAVRVQVTGATSHGDCTAQGWARTMTVRLGAPLAHRELTGCRPRARQCR